jgi:hypothetical protein
MTELPTPEEEESSVIGSGSGRKHWPRPQRAGAERVVLGEPLDVEGSVVCICVRCVIRKGRRNELLRALRCGRDDAPAVVVGLLAAPPPVHISTTDARRG